MRQWEIGHKCVKLCKVGRFKLKNIWASDKSGNLDLDLTLSLTLSHIICFHVCAQFLFQCLCSKVTVTISHSFTLSFALSQYAERFLFSCLCSKVTLTLSHSFTLSISDSRYAHTVRATIYLDTLASFFRNLANDRQKSKYLVPCFQVKINNSGWLLSQQLGNIIYHYFNIGNFLIFLGHPPEFPIM